MFDLKSHTPRKAMAFMLALVTMPAFAAGAGARCGDSDIHPTSHCDFSGKCLVRPLLRNLPCSDKPGR